MTEHKEPYTNETILFMDRIELLSTLLTALRFLGLSLAHANDKELCTANLNGAQAQINQARRLLDNMQEGVE